MGNAGRSEGVKMAIDVNALAQSFSIVGISSGNRMLAGEALPLRLEAGIPIGDAVITEVITGAVDLDLLFKHVKLANVDATAPNGPWPHEAVATQLVEPGGGAVPDVNVIITEGLSSAPLADEVEAWASTISGTIPLGFREIEDSVQIDYQWSIIGTDPDDKPLPADHIAITDGSPTAAALTLVARPILDVMEDGSEPLGDGGLCVQAQVRVRLAVTGADSGWVTIPPEPICIALAPLRVPEVGALFRDQDFKGNAIFLTVPERSAMSGPGEVLSVVGNLRPTVERLEQAASLTAWAAGIGGLVGAIRELATRLPTVPNVGFKHQKQHNDLGKYNFIHASWRWDDDIEDRASSAVAITVVRYPAFYQHDEQDGERLAIDARPTRPGQLGGATIANLHVNTPASVPPGAIRRSGAPSGGWGDVISSYRWEDVDE